MSCNIDYIRLFIKKVSLFVYCGVFCLLLSACDQEVELFNGLQESEANDIIGVLLQSNIDSHKMTAKEGVKVIIAQKDFSRAVEILRAHELPSPRRSKMGDVFKKESMISSPLEERARYVYALSQEIERTLASIDGVLNARVHVVLPEYNAFNEPASVRSSAAVFIKYRQGKLNGDISTQVKEMVINSIPNLSKDRVSVVLIPSNNIETENTKIKEAEDANKKGSPLRLILIILAVVIAGAGSYSIYYVISKRRIKQEAISENDAVPK